MDEMGVYVKFLKLKLLFTNFQQMHGRKVGQFISFLPTCSRIPFYIYIYECISYVVEDNFDQAVSDPERVTELCAVIRGFLL